MQQSARSVAGTALACLMATASAIAVLWSVRPDLTVSSATARGDDLAYAVAWILAIAGASWLLLTTLACLVALVRGGPGLAARVARWGPPVGRRLLQGALAGTFVVVPATANATTAPPAPLVLHVGPDGHLTGVPEPNPGTDAPVVRTPPSTTPLPPSSTTTSAPRPMPLPLPPPAPVVRAPSASPAAPPHETSPARRVATARRHIVRAGDNLWRIARSEVARVTGVDRPDDRTVAGYWVQVVAANRATLRSGDPSLIYPGELVLLPVVAAQ